MSLYIAQEFLGVLLVLAGLMGTVLFFRDCRHSISGRHSPDFRGANSRVKPLAKLSAKELWMRRAGVGPIQQSRPHA